MLCPLGGSTSGGLRNLGCVHEHCPGGVSRWLQYWAVFTEEQHCLGGGGSGGAQYRVVSTKGQFYWSSVVIPGCVHKAESLLGPQGCSTQSFQHGESTTGGRGGGCATGWCQQDGCTAQGVVVLGVAVLCCNYK